MLRALLPPPWRAFWGSDLSRLPNRRVAARLWKHRQSEQVPLTLEAVTQVMRAYLESCAVHIGPDFDGWTAYYFPNIKHWAGKRHGLTVGMLVEWACGYLAYELGAESSR